MKQVFTNDEVAHVWAQQKQTEGRNSTRSVFFEGPSIYSYGRHFEMARFIQPGIVLVTNRSYSVTTARHLSNVHSAIRHHLSFTVPSFTDHAENLAYYFSEAKRLLIESGRSRKHGEWKLNQAQAMVDTALKYREHFTPEYTNIFGEDLIKAQQGTFFDPETIAAIQASAKEQAQKEKERKKAENEKRERLQREDLEKWCNNGQNVPSWNFVKTCLRVKDNEVETTKGARVPLIEARKLYRAMKAGIDLSGRMIGHYTVTRLTDTELIIGCHNIPLSEVERIAPEVMRKEEVTA